MNRWPILLLPLGLVGCGGAAPPTTTTTPAPVAPAHDDQPWVDNEDYLNWKSFPLNTTVRRKKVSRNANGSVTEVTTLRLVERSDAKAVVEFQVTVERPNTRPQVNPPALRDYPAKFRLPTGMSADQFQKPSLKAVATGEEVVAVGGKEYRATVFTWEDGTEAGPMPNKLWRSDAMPGRFVKQESRVAKVGNSTTEEVVEVKVP